jgi:2-polyprenyl-3-methyl-5-hydroxy-6-metoxy-1,4-benzoquinol methylase
MPVNPTPVRALGTRGSDGTVVLRDAGLTYRDGGEEAVLRILHEAKDLRSTTDELIRTADGWAQTYHLHPARANILRGLQLPTDARVLEIGAGCGAITRYLGEQCALVDALEPMPLRAAAARARTRDLDSVDVFVGELSDVPAEAAYDVVVVIGVLEYVGNGTANQAPYLDFLKGISERLVDTGTLVLAIENQLGVKYLAGAPEDHTNRMFDGLEDYPAASPARTFSRRRLAALMTEAGLAPEFLVAFPDYKITRAVFDRFPEATRSLLHRVPQFPSPDWMAPNPRLADERSTWRTLVDAGLEIDTGNSFLVVAGKPAAAGSYWPAGTAGVFYSVGRRTPYSTRTAIESVGETVQFRRQAVDASASGPADRFTLVESVHAYEEGRDLVTHVVAERNADVDTMLRQWLTMLDERSTDGQTDSIDLVPHNLVVDADGRVQSIDIELIHPVRRDQVVRRGIYWLAYHVARSSAHDRWPGVTTVRQLTTQLGSLVGLDPDGGWLETAIDEEARVQAEIHFLTGRDADVDAAVERNRTNLRAALDAELRHMPLGLRPSAAILASNQQLVLTVGDRDATIAALQSEQEHLHRELDMRAARITELEQRIAQSGSTRRIAERLLPAGTARRRLVVRLIRGTGSR